MRSGGSSSQLGGRPTQIRRNGKTLITLQEGHLNIERSTFGQSSLITRSTHSLALVRLTLLFIPALHSLRREFYATLAIRIGDVLALA